MLFLGVGDGEHGEQLGDVAVRDEMFCAIQNVLVAMLDRASSHRRDIATRAWLGNAERSESTIFCNWDDKFFLLLRGRS